MGADRVPSGSTASVRGDAPARAIDPAPRPSLLALMGRHQLASMAATAVDYLVMILCVSVAGLGPVSGTAIGAGSGAITNFTLGRNFTFRAQDRGTVRAQAIRYAAVSLMSLGWNAFGEHVFAVMLGLQYVVARLIVGTLVGFAWNFPMHRYFVFRS